MRFIGYVLLDSLQDQSVLDEVTIRSQRHEPITGWDGATIEFTGDEQTAYSVAERLSRALRPKGWYLTIFSEDGTLYVVFPDRTFKLPKGDEASHRSAVEHGRNFDIPDHQLDFKWADGSLDEWYEAEQHFNEVQTRLIMAAARVNHDGRDFSVSFSPDTDVLDALEEFDRELKARGTLAESDSEVTNGSAPTLHLRGRVGEVMVSVLREAVRRERQIEL